MWVSDLDFQRNLQLSSALLSLPFVMLGFLKSCTSLDQVNIWKSGDSPDNSILPFSELLTHG